MNVKKKNGEVVPFDIQKIRNHANAACRGLSINPLELESSITAQFTSGIKTSDIQQILVMTAVKKADTENPEWLTVAGRLAMSQLHGEVIKNTKIPYEEFENYLAYAERNKLYRNISKDYSESEISHIAKMVNPEKDFNMVISQVMSLEAKYLLKNLRGITEYPQFADLANSMILASIETDKMHWQKEIFNSLVNEELSLATPFKSNLRLPDGNTGSCFILPTGDNLRSISKGWKDMATISKEGGGIGVYLGNLRPENAYSPNIPKANNISRWVKIINDIAIAINQRGIRKGAITPALDWSHMDIFDFIEVKAETGGGDLRDKSFDIFPQIVVDDYFIDAVYEDREVYLFDHHELKLKYKLNPIDKVGKELYSIHETVYELAEAGKLKHVKKIKAKDLWKESLRIWFETGDFYITHKDGLNLSNYLAGYEMDGEFLIANSANLCVESFSITKTPTSWVEEVKDNKLVRSESNGLYHSCNLLSINLGVIKTEAQLKRVCRVAVRVLDNSVTLGTMPVKEAQNSSEMLRNVGIGTVGVADWMAWNKLSYEKPDDLKQLEAMIEKIAWYCYEESIELAKEKGAYKLFEHANYDKMFGKPVAELDKLSPNGFKWSEMAANIKKYGIRNFLLLAIAPNTSTGLVMNAVASYLPPQAKMNYQTLAEMTIPVMPRYLKQRNWYYKGKFQYSAHVLIKATRSLQRWIDTGISMKVPINPEMSKINEISDEIIDGFRSHELKAVYYCLAIDGIKDGCTDCAN